eukprot:1170145-Pleurochrysis_carterae.AAC.1
MASVSIAKPLMGLNLTHAAPITRVEAERPLATAATPVAAAASGATVRPMSGAIATNDGSHSSER